LETTFTPIAALAGGTLIGLSAVLLWLAIGRTAGISGILGGLLAPRLGDIAWRIAFVAGLFAGPIAYRALTADVPPVSLTSSAGLLIAGGLLVGYGTRLGGGCTSGHGVCGLARLSPRSVVATVVFLAAAIAIVFLRRHVLGG
jgi:uncharacterized membrane protein YedE/YeeE